MTGTAHNIAWFSEIDKEDISLVGGKGANLGEMTKAGFNVPNGFIVTSHAYYDFVRENNLSVKISHLLATADIDNSKSLGQVSNHIKNMIISSKLSDELSKEIVANYNKLGNLLDDCLVAVRSSATAEDLSGASFAGQQETFLNVKGDTVLLERIKQGWASLFDERAIFYRHQQKFDKVKIGIALVVQKMIESEKSGIMFTIDPVTNDKSKVVIEAIYGLGELIVQGTVNPDHYEINKQELTILSKQTSFQEFLLEKKGLENKKIKLSKKTGEKQKISDKEIVELATLGKKLEKHYYFPQDVEWAIEKDNIYLVQTRAVTTTKTEIKEIDESKLIGAKIILKGDPASPGIKSGPVKIINSAKEINKIMPGDVLVALETNPDYVPAMKKAAAIVTDNGGRTSHAAIVARELGIPAVVGTKEATKQLKNGNIVTVNGGKGEIYQGGFLASSIKTEKDLGFKTATKIYVNLAEPELAQNIAQKNVDGVGLLRAEFMMAGIGIHPKKMIKDGKKNEYVEKLATDLAKFCKAFDGKPVIYRTSDFKTNEYKNLIGGKDYEPLESNPMLGFRGAFRYIHDPEVFKLELLSIQMVREKYGYKNLWIMIPFVRTVEELVKVKKIINNSGLIRSDTFKIWMMVEIPSNIILLNKFIEVGIDGVSIGSNDLTMLMLGTDRDNFEVANEFDEMNSSMLWAFKHVIKTAQKYNITSSICGQAPSNYPELVKYLVEWGVTSVSVSPDAIENTRKMILHFEKELLRK